MLTLFGIYGIISTKKQWNASKRLHLEWVRIYWYSNGQIHLSDFKQPMGMNLKESNRWVKRAILIPWNDIEKCYAALFTNRKSNVSKPLRLALGACIIQADYVILFIAAKVLEIGILLYLHRHFLIGILTAEVLGEINEMILVQSTVIPAAEPMETLDEK